VTLISVRRVIILCWKNKLEEVVVEAGKRR